MAKYHHGEIIHLVNEDYLTLEVTDKIVIDKCIIEEINLVGVLCKSTLEIRNCIVKRLLIYGTWFEGGLTFTDNIVLSEIDYQAGGHNRKPIVIKGNIFHEFVSFFDCHFEDMVEVIGNIFSRGTDLLAKENKGFDNLFPKGYSINGNIGKMDLIV